jgi:hypothetical protein
MMKLIIPAITLFLFSIFLQAYYSYRLQGKRYKRQPIALICVIVVLFVGGTIMLFFATGWKWGLIGLVISFLMLLGVTLGSIAVHSFQQAEQLDPLFHKRIKEVFSLEEQHNAELEEFWLLTSPDECANLMVTFLEKLRLKWPREYSQLNPERLPDTISKGFKNSITQAYTVGYMRGNGWISQEHLVDFGLYLGDKLARDITLVFKGVKSKSIAFASSYTAVAARGHLKVLLPALTPKPAPTPAPAPTPEELLENVRFIAKVKTSLPIHQRGGLNTYGVYVQSGRNGDPTIPKEGILYMVGGKWIPKLIFLDDDSGETIVIKYEKGDWLGSLDLSYEKAKEVWTAIQVNDGASILQALSIEEPDRPRYIDFDKQTRGEG